MSTTSILDYAYRGANNLKRAFAAQQEMTESGLLAQLIRLDRWLFAAHRLEAFAGHLPGPTRSVKESEVRRFMLLHFGFERPTPEIMAAWGKWFESVADRTADQGGFHGGAREISHSGSTDLPMGMESITGYSIINAENLAEAEEIAKNNPFIASIRVYEIVEH